MKIMGWAAFALFALAPVQVTANITISDASIDFGSVFVTESSAQRAVAVTNRGSEGVAITVDHACHTEGFDVWHLCGDLVPGGSCKVLGKFSPVEVGASHCAVSIRSSGGQNQSLVLQGMGLDHPQVVAHRGPAHGSQTPGNDGLGAVTEAPDVALRPSRRAWA